METLAENPLRLLKIEEELAGPDAAEAMARYDGQLIELDARIRAAQLSGLSPNEYAQVDGLREAVVVARKILRLTVKGDCMA